MKLFIERLKRLTADNQHIEARILIASRYSYLKRHKEMYKAIQLISGYERKTSRNLLNTASAWLFSEPNPHDVPNVIVPKHISDTFYY